VKRGLFLRSLHSAMHFGQKILAKIFCNNARLRQRAQVIDGHQRQKS